MLEASIDSVEFHGNYFLSSVFLYFLQFFYYGQLLAWHSGDHVRDLHVWKWADDESHGIDEIHQAVHVAQPMLLQHGNEDQGVHYDQNSRVPVHIPARLSKLFVYTLYCTVKLR